MRIMRACAYRHLRGAAVGALIGLSAASGALAQSTPPAAPSDPATVKAAREVVTQMQGDRTTTLNSMSGPMVAMMQQMGVKEQDRAQVLVQEVVQEVVLPMLTARYDDLLDIQARSFASVLSKEDLQAIGAFYATPAGKRLAAAQPQLAQAQLTGMTQWMGQMMPEMQAKLTQAIKAHGWGPGGKAK